MEIERREAGAGDRKERSERLIGTAKEEKQCRRSTEQRREAGGNEQSVGDERPAKGHARVCAGEEKEKGRSSEHWE